MGVNTLICIIGPTAVGKTETAINIAQEFNTEIISADSRQFYKEISIGTAKPDAEEQNLAKHHFINNKSICEEYNASDFENEVILFLENYFKENKVAILCGGSGMYIDAVCKGFDSEVPSSDDKIRAELLEELNKYGISYLQEKLKNLDPKFYETIDLNNSKRLLRAIEVCLISGKTYTEIRVGETKKRDFNIVKIGLKMGRDKLYQRINSRVDKMLEVGLLDEVKSVEGYKDKNALKTVGYQELFEYFEGNYTLEHAIEKIKTNSRRYAKRQLTWFKKDSEIEWFHPLELDEILLYIRKRISENV